MHEKRRVCRSGVSGRNQGVLDIFNGTNTLFLTGLYDRKQSGFEDFPRFGSAPTGRFTVRHQATQGPFGRVVRQGDGRPVRLDGLPAPAEPRRSPSTPWPSCRTMYEGEGAVLE